MSRENKTNERLGFCSINNQGSRFKVVHYKDANNVWVEFYDHIKAQVTIVKTRWDTIERKNIIDIYYPSVEGIGCMGRTTGMNKNGTRKESYYKWGNMLQRCYNEKRLLKNPTYKGCEVSKEWLCFANFEKDYEELLKESNFPENMELGLDKDIIHKGNKIYSKENCVLVDQRINSLFTKCNKLRGELPIGVYYYKNKKTNPYMAMVSSGIIPLNRKTPYQLKKYFSTPEEAFYWYKEQKEQVIKKVADEYVALGYITSDSRLYKAMYDWVVEITD